jgi:hypothetical protein
MCQDEPAEVWNANPDVDFCNGFEDSWSCWWQDAEHAGGGSTDLGAAILGTYCPELGDLPAQVWQASGGGEKTSLVQSDDAAGGPGSFRDLIEQDPDLVWCPAGSGGDNNPPYGCPMESTSCNTGCVTESPRVRSAPIIDVTDISGSGANNTFEIKGVTGVFIEKVACNYSMNQFGGPAGNWNVYVRLMTTVGSGPNESEEPPTGNELSRFLQLIE